jgi:hypothetical protein
MNCEHDYKNTLSKNGMYVVKLCHKCLHEMPYRPDSPEVLDAVARVFDKYGDAIKNLAEK